MTSLLKGCSAIIGIAALTGVAMADLAVQGTPLQRINIDDFARVAETPEVLPVDARMSQIVWDNGPADNVTAHQNQLTNIGFFQAADDFIVKHGFFMYVDTIKVRMLVSSNIDGIMTKPVVALNIYDDCSGRPNLLVANVTDPTKIVATNLGASIFAGFNKWEFEFTVQQFLAGYGRWYVSPYGIANIQDGLYFWCSANFGQIQGVQGQLKNGAEPWMDVQDCDCPGICTDFYFQICGHICCLTKNNVPHDTTGGAKSLQLKGATIDTARAVDNFQITPHTRVEVCRVEAWFATNCPLEKIFFEIYNNLCNMPSNKIYTYDVDLYPLTTDTGADFMGVNIYHVVWPEVHGVTLDPGRDYWLSIVARGTGSILDKGFWMYLVQGLCNINITQGKVKDPFVAGLEDFTFVSVATAGPPRDFAFKLYTNDIGLRSDEESEGGGTPPPTSGSTPVTGPAPSGMSLGVPLIGR
jgi:hypothetical protein